MKINYSNGNYGYGHAKQALYELVMTKFSKQRKLYSHYMSNPDKIDKILAIGAEKATVVANNVLSRVKSKLGY